MASMKEPPIDLNLIPDGLLADLLDHKWGSDASPRDAVDVLDLAVAVAGEAGGGRTVELPLELARVILECAKLGLPKIIYNREGRGRTPDSHWTKEKKEAVIDWAKGLAEDLVSQGKEPSKLRAQGQAAYEASKQAKHMGLKLTETTIKRRMDNAD